MSFVCFFCLLISKLLSNALITDRRTDSGTRAAHMYNGDTGSVDAINNTNPVCTEPKLNKIYSSHNGYTNGEFDKSRC